MTTHVGVGHAAGYSLGEATVDVVTDTADDNRWLKEFLTPWGNATAFGHSDVHVRFTCSDAAFDDLDRRFASATRPIPCFALDSQLVTLPGWDDGESAALADKELGCFYRVLGRHVDVVGRSGEHRARLGLMRVVREILTARRLRGGGLLDVHAAAFETGGCAVLIAGPKHAGKTTLLCYALTSSKARLIANDRVFVDVDRARGDVCGVPTIVSVSPDTLRLFPRLRGEPGEGQGLLDFGERHVERAAPRAYDFALSPGELAQRLGASCVPGAPLAGIVFPEIAADTKTWTFDTLSAADGLALLATSFYGVHRKGPSQTIFGSLGGPVSRWAEPHVLASRLDKKVRFIRCRLGPRAYEESADRWLRALGLDVTTDHTRQ